MTIVGALLAPGCETVRPGYEVPPGGYDDLLMVSALGLACMGGAAEDGVGVGDAIELPIGGTSEFGTHELSSSAIAALRTKLADLRMRASNTTRRA